MPQAVVISDAVRRQFADFDELSQEARQWNLDLRQLDRGAFRGELLQFGIGGVYVTEARFSRALIQKGTPPPSLRTIGVPGRRDVAFSWRGIPVTGNDLVVFPHGADLFCTSTPDFHVYTCSIPENVLAVTCNSLAIDELDKVRGDATVVRCRVGAIESVRKSLRKLCARTKSDSLPTEQRLVDLANRDLPLRLLSAITTSHGARASGITRKRELALARAEAYVERYASEDISISDISRVAQVSQRTLEYAFVERFGVTPKAFLMAHRLIAVRRELRAADPTTAIIADVANRLGFWHLGQFAADYRRQFDELPSHTLCRANG